MEKELTVSGTEQLKAEVPSLVKEAQALVIRNDADNQKAADLINLLAKVVNRAKEILEPHNAAIKAATAARDNLKALIYTPPFNVRESLRAQSGAYVYAETARRNAIAEAARIQQEKETKKAEAKAIKQGVPVPIVPFTPIIAVAPVQATGASFTEQYSAEVRDMMALVKAVAAGKADISCLEPNGPFLNSKAKAVKKEGEILPGVFCVMKMIPRGARQ